MSDLVFTNSGVEFLLEGKVLQQSVMCDIKCDGRDGNIVIFERPNVGVDRFGLKVFAIAHEPQIRLVGGGVEALVRFLYPATLSHSADFNSLKFRGVWKVYVEA